MEGHMSQRKGTARVATLAIVLAAIVGLAAAFLMRGPSAAERTQIAENCRQRVHRHVTARIAGWSAVIQAGRERGVNLAIAYANRAIAYDGKSQYDRAKRDIELKIRTQPIDVGPIDTTRDYDHVIQPNAGNAAFFVDRANL